VVESVHPEAEKSMNLLKYCNDVAVRTKVSLTMACVLLGAVVFGLFAIQQLSQVNAVSADIRDNWLPGIRELGDFRYYVTRFRSAEGSYLLSTPGPQQEKQLKRLAPISAKADDMRALYEARVSAGRERELVNRVDEAWSAYKPMLDRAIEINRTQGREAAAAYFMGPMRDSFDRLNTALDGAIGFNQEGGIAAGNLNQVTYESARLWIFLVLGAGVFFCLLARWALIACVSTPLVDVTAAMAELAAGRLDAQVPHAGRKDEIGKLAATMTEFKNQLAEAERSKAEQTGIIVSSIGNALDNLAKGNLTHRITAALRGPFSKLKEDFNGAMSRLQETMKAILATAGQIATGAGEISQAADDLSHRTEQQAASLEETAAALEQITANMKKTAANTHEVNSSISTATVVAKEGGRVVETATTAMDAIAQSSKQITDIIGVIDEIAFQTNLLALNAGVEAARAGDAGKGFAVVASEVRALAGRSSDAAKQIKALIHTSGDHVADGVKLFGESGKALTRIVDQVQHINSLVGEMAGAAEQQSTGIQQVNTAVSQMDQVTQQNAAMVEQSTAASRNLAHETQELRSLIAYFDVGEAPVAQREQPRAAAKPQPHAAARPQRRAAAGARAPAPQSEDWTEF
jgi:methyl-accepting chemotaxis protein